MVDTKKFTPVVICYGFGVGEESGKLEQGYLIGYNNSSFSFFDERGVVQETTLKIAEIREGILDKSKWKYSKDYLVYPEIRIQ